MSVTSPCNPTGKFWGKTKEIATDTFDNTGSHDAAMFNKSLKNVAEYLQFNHGNDVSEVVCNMLPGVITILNQPTGKTNPMDSTKTLPVTDVDLHIWKCKYSKAHDLKDKHDENMAKAYIVIYQQCSPTFKNDLKAAPAFATVRSNQDVIALLKLVQSLCGSYDAKTQSVMATVASHKHLFTHYQKDGIDNHSYHREFMAHVETVKTYGGMGAIGVVPTFLAAKIQEMAAAGEIADASNPTDPEKAAAISAVREEYLTTLMLSSLNRDCFGELRTDLKNQYGYGEDRYPKTTDACLSMLNRWTPSAATNTPRTPCNPPTQSPKPVEDEAPVFAQDAAKRTPTLSMPPYKSPLQSDDNSSHGSKLSLMKPTNVCCKSCGLLGHTLAVCPNTKPPAPVHAMTESNDASKASDTSSVIILTQQTACHPINPKHLLLDSQSTVNLFSNPKHVNNARQATTPIDVHCNKGSIPTSTVADFGTNEVCINPNGIANVLSL
jgi:hypothetical protein